MTAPELTRYRPDHKESLVELWADAFAAEPADRLAYLEWKYERNPYLPEPILFVAVDPQGRVVGARGFSGSMWQASTGDALIPCAEDFAIALEHRGSGLAAALMRFALEQMTQLGFTHVLNSSGGAITVLQSIAMGWKSVGAMGPVVRLSRRQQLERTVRGSVLDLVRKMRLEGVARRVRRALSHERQDGEEPFGRLDAAGRHATANGADVIVEPAPRPEAMARLVARLEHDGRIRHVRDRAFFEWRFRNPSRDYRFLFHERGGDLDGFLVVARDRSDRFSLVDWEGRTLQVREELLRRVLEWGAFSSLDAWTGSLRDESKTLLTRAGFVPTELDLRARGMPCVLLRELDETGDWSVAGTPALDPSSWDIRMIDTMRG